MCDGLDPRYRRLLEDTWASPGRRQQAGTMLLICILYEIRYSHDVRKKSTIKEVETVCM